MKSIRLYMTVIVAAVFLVAMLAARSAQAQAYKEKVLHRFTGGTDGATPYAGVIRDAKGNLYGTTNLGGYLNCPGEQGIGCGIIFKLSTTGKETVLHRFMGGTDGELPFAAVIRDAQGNLYGTTYAGGVEGCLQYYGCGVVFKMDTSGKETVLHSFCPEYPNCPDGANPNAEVIQDAHGNLYGTTAEGGNSGCFAGSGCGIVFKLSKVVKETVLHRFTGGTDGATPYAGVIRDAKGNLYGTTYYGGKGKCNDGFGTGCGVVFKLGTTGKETVLHSFTGGTDGAYPEGVIQDAKGNLYGTTKEGGDLSGCDGLGCGVVFKLSTTGKETVLHRFTGGTDGSNPAAGVIQDAKGNLYGTTLSGGQLSCGNGSGCGVVFKLSTTEKETVLHRFTGGTGGANPDAGVIQDAKGNLYGTAYAGGDSSCGYQGAGCGVVFELTPALDARH